MRSFASRVNAVLQSSDILLEILDARFPEETRNRQFEQRILESGKKLIFVLNKADLVPVRYARKQLGMLRATAPAIAFSLRTRTGKGALRAQLGILSRGKPAKVGVIGYPNTGKSSVINLLRGRHVAATSSVAGFTRGERLVRISSNIVLVDTPGIIPFDERDEFKLAMLCSKTPGQIKDAEGVAEHMLALLAAHNPQSIEARYSLKPSTDPSQTLASIALSKKRLLAHGAPDTNAAATIVIRDWQTGKLSLL